LSTAIVILLQESEKTAKRNNLINSLV